MERKDLTIGLFGYGCVGKGLYQVLQKTQGLKAEIKTICVKQKNKARDIDSSYFTFDRNKILNDKSINLIVELIDDADASFEIVKSAIEKGKAVVTANKKMLAEHLNEIIELQQQYNVPVLYEASCCASIPIIRNLEEYYDNDLLESIEGIVNGSTNYILTRTSTDKLDYQSALALAQKRGFAESNPQLDVGGFDAKYKLLILLLHAFGIQSKPENIFNYGIEHINDFDCQYAFEKKYKIKLLARAYKTDSGDVAAYVLPHFVTNTDKLYNIDDEYNGVITKTSFADTQFFVGKGAGAFPTASAVLSDISALTYAYKYEYKKLKHNTASVKSDLELQVFVRFPNEQLNEIKSYFISINETLVKTDWGYIIGQTSLSRIHILNNKFSNSISIIGLN